MFKILMCGDRNWTAPYPIKLALKRHTAGKSKKDILVIHGGARGADSIAGEEAKAMGLAVQVFPAQWDTYGRAAGPIRNTQMLNERPDLVLAFHNDLLASRGTKDMCRRAVRAGVKVWVTGIKFDEVHFELTQAWYKTLKA